MTVELVSPPKASPGDRVAVLSPSFAAPAVGEAVHEQAMRRLGEATGLVPVEYPTTRRLDAPAVDRAADLNAAFADPQIRAVLATASRDNPAGCRIGGRFSTASAGYRFLAVAPTVAPTVAAAVRSARAGSGSGTGVTASRGSSVAAVAPGAAR